MTRTAPHRAVVIGRAAAGALAATLLSCIAAGAVLAQSTSGPATQSPPPAAGQEQAQPEAIARPGQAPGTFIGAESTVVGGAGVIKATPSGAGVPAASASRDNDYPTIARADYVFACMQVNGQSRDVLEKCSCSIDVIASLLPYDRYEEAETIMSVRQRGGKATDLWNAPVPKEMVKDLKRAQVEGELRCF